VTPADEKNPLTYCTPAYDGQCMPMPTEGPVITAMSLAAVARIALAEKLQCLHGRTLRAINLLQDLRRALVHADAAAAGAVTVCMYIYIYIYMYIYYIYIYNIIYIYIYIYAQINTSCTLLHTCMYIHTYKHTSIYISKLPRYSTYNIHV